MTCEVVTPLAQGPLLSVHWNVFVPIDKPDTVVVGLVELANVPVPVTTVHWPVAGVSGALAAKVALAAQTCWFGPALALGLAGLNTTISTSSKEDGGVHGPLLMVQRNRFKPMESPVTVVFLSAALAKVPVPVTTVHWPDAGAMGALAARVVERLGAHNC